MQPNSNNSSVNKKLLNLDIIRAVAAVMIVLVHLELFGWGGHGVELFLLLTGYTAFLSIDRHKEGLRGFCQAIMGLCSYIFSSIWLYLERGIRRSR